jgi:hypothetical protein
VTHKTKGLSPKLHGPIGAPLAVVVYELIATGTLDRQQLALLAVAAVGALWGALAGPGKLIPIEESQL